MADEIQLEDVVVEEKFLEQARRDILAFTLYTKPDYKVNWHHKLIADKLNAFARGEIQFLMVFTSPRHGKSELVSRRFPAFWHGLYPDSEIMAASYLDSLAGDMTIDVQNIIDSKEYQRVFPETKIWPPGTSYAKGTRNSSEHHIIGRRGKYRGQGVGGSFTGKGASVILVDDPIKGREIADSVTFRERLWNFWNNDLFSRLETDLKNGRKGQALITQTRWHLDDLSGRLIELMKSDPNSVQWDILNLPAIRVDLDDESDPREIGEALWPEKYNLEQLNQIKSSIGPRAWSSLYQQSPILDGGGLFSDYMFDCVDLPTEFDYTFVTADTAYNDKQENDFTVFAAWGVKNNELYLIDVWRKQIKSSDVEKPAAAFIKQFMKYGFRGAWIEPKGHGIYLNQMLPRPPYGIMIPSETDIKEFFSDRKFNKVERANNAVPHLSNRKVHFNNKINDKETLLAECLSFPKGKHDDFLDCCVDAIKFVFGKELTVFDFL